MSVEGSGRRSAHRARLLQALNGVLRPLDLQLMRRSAARACSGRAEPDGTHAAVTLGDGIVLRNVGHCSICDGPALFTARHTWFRDHYVCDGCGSVPRERALVRVLQEHFPGWRDGSLHESSPASAASSKLKRECPRYVGSHFWRDVPPGAMRGEFRCEDLQRQTFPDGSFDLVITQDVMEHVVEPEEAFREIGRTLRPGGAHVFTTPIYKDLERSERRVRVVDGRVEHLLPPEYHGNPIDPDGSLVAIHYGRDVPALIAAATGLETEVHSFQDASAGLLGEFLDVLVTYKG